MEDILFYMGILVGISFLQGFITWSMHQKKKPYLLAFSILMFWQSAVLMIESVSYLALGKILPLTVIIGMDYLIIPLFYLEVLCLANQDINALPWKKRWQRTLYVSMPVLIYFIIIFANDIKVPNTYIFIFILGYVAVVTLLIYLHLNKFKFILHKEQQVKKKEDHEIGWVKAIMALMVIQYTMYALYDMLPYHVIYYATTYFVIILHGYFIRKQLPTDTRRLMAMQEKLIEKQEEAIEELKDATEGLKRKMDMDTMMKAFRVEHPSFDTRLRNITETKLTQRDIYLCILIYQGKRIPEIADFLGISPASVEVARHRLRNKLNLDKGTNMNRTIQSIIEATDTV